MSRIFILLFLFAFSGAINAVAHRDYENKVSDFKRSDGATISIFEHYTDGLMGGDPVRILLRLIDGTLVAQTEYTTDVLVRHVRDGVDIYQYKSTWLPIATRVDHFDGFALTDVTAVKRSTSLWVHLAANGINYGIAVGFFACLWWGRHVLTRLPRDRASIVLMQIAGLIVLGFATLIYIAMVLFSSLSPLIVLCFGAIGGAIYLSIRAFRSSKRMKESTAQAANDASPR